MRERVARAVAKERKRCIGAAMLWWLGEDDSLCGTPEEAILDGTDISLDDLVLVPKVAVATILETHAPAWREGDEDFVVQVGGDCPPWLVDRFSDDLWKLRQALIDEEKK